MLLGHGELSTGFLCHVFFPNMVVVKKGKTQLTAEQQEIWIDKILLPALRAVCPADVLHHHPRCFAEIQDKTKVRKEVSLGPTAAGKYDLDIHYFIATEYLSALWTKIMHIIKRNAGDKLKEFSKPFLVLNAYGLKLRTKRDTLQQSRQAFQDMLKRRFQMEQMDLKQTWVDVAFEDIPVKKNTTLLHRTDCLKHWVNSMKGQESTGLSSRFFNWSL